MDLIPYRIRRSSVDLRKYLGYPTLLSRPVADFRSFQSLGTVYDGGLMTLFVLGEYYKKTKDITFVRKFEKQIYKAIDYYQKRFPEKLISEWFLCEWADAILKVGKVLYTNVLYILALRSVVSLKKALEQNVNEIEQHSKQVETLLRTTFWTGTYFADWFDYKRQDYLASFPNLLAVYYGIATKEEAESIVKEVTSSCLRESGVASNYPKYPFWRIPLQNYFAGVPDYHNGIFWLQPWIYYILAVSKLGDTKTATQEVLKLENVVSKYPVIYENYERDWSFVNRPMYHAEGPFAWSSGLLVYMLDSIT